LPVKLTHSAPRDTREHASHLRYEVTFVAARNGVPFAPGAARASAGHGGQDLSAILYRHAQELLKRPAATTQFAPSRAAASAPRSCAAGDPTVDRNRARFT